MLGLSLASVHDTLRSNRYNKKIMTKFQIPRILVVPIYVAILAALGVIIGLIAKWAGAYNPIDWGFFSTIGILAVFIAFIWLRSLWWFIAGKGDYIGRNGLLKRLWNKIFKK